MKGMNFEKAGSERNRRPSRLSPARFLVLAICLSPDAFFFFDRFLIVYTSKRHFRRFVNLSFRAALPQLLEKSVGYVQLAPPLSEADVLLVRAVEVAAAGPDKAVFRRERLEICAHVRIVAGVTALDAFESAFHAVLDQLAQLRVVETVLEGVGKHGCAARLADDLDRALDREELPRDEERPVLVQQSVKGILHVRSTPVLDQDLGKVRPPYKVAEARMHPFDVDIDADGSEHLAELDIALLAVAVMRSQRGILQII